MQDKLEKLIKVVYRKWRGDLSVAEEAHPDEETLACFLENRLSRQESESLKTHLINCDACAEKVAMQLKILADENRDAPAELIQAAKGIMAPEGQASVLEIFLRLKEKAVELLGATGDILVGQELVPAPVLRSRKQKDFQDEVTILKDFKDIRVEAKIENKAGRAFSLIVVIKEKPTLKVMKDLRVSLIKDDLELESYVSDTGKVTFEHVLLGRYTIEISSLDSKLASVLLDIKA
jgi:hypothetical protein